MRPKHGCSANRHPLLSRMQLQSTGENTGKDLSTAVNPNFNSSGDASVRGTLTRDSGCDLRRKRQESSHSITQHNADTGVCSLPYGRKRCPGDHH
ncbi:hypothetical protein LZ30DRAFT_696537 [Colletotrichum cereale]|nr:hypothetical protein LZ30DRAFT_696537 [Colletotrichum cereale]